MIPRGITTNDVRDAALKIDQEGIPNRRNSYRYDLLLGGKRYPPKLVIQKAAKRSLGKEYSHRKFNAVEAKDYLIGRGFTIVEKSGKRERILGRVLIEDGELTFVEGRALYKEHRTLERDSRVAKKAKEKRLQIAGELRCDVCGFSFAEKYGDHGAGYIEAHHKIPISEMKGGRRTTLDDIALVCSNCHRMLHRTKTATTVDQLRDLTSE